MELPSLETTVLADGVLTLRPWSTVYIPAMVEVVQESLPSLGPWMSWANPDYGEKEALDWVQLMRQHWTRGLAYQFAILDPQDETLLGGCGINHIHTSYRFGNLGYWVRSSRRGQGIAPHAARMGARFAFEQAGLVRVEIVVAGENQASLRTAEKAGAHREGLLRNRMVVRDDVYEAVMHSLTPEDFGLRRSEVDKP